MKTMTVKQMIDALKDQPMDAKITVWMDGERLDIIDLDDSFAEDGFIEINAVQWNMRHTRPWVPSELSTSYPQSYPQGKPNEIKDLE